MKANRVIFSAVSAYTGRKSHFHDNHVNYYEKRHMKWTPQSRRRIEANAQSWRCIGSKCHKPNTTLKQINQCAPRFLVELHIFWPQIHSERKDDGWRRHMGVHDVATKNMFSLFSLAFTHFLHNKAPCNMMHNPGIVWNPSFFTSVWQETHSLRYSRS